jgi:hypothetical protein
MSTTAHQNPNQFSQTPNLGSPDLAYSFNTKSAIINPNSVATGLQVGQAMKLIAGNVPGLVVDQAAAGDVPYGIIANVLKKNTYSPGQAVELSCAGNVLYLESAAAIVRGALVENVPTGPTVQTKASGAVLGRALDQASGAGQLIRIEINPALTA